MKATKLALILVVLAAMSTAMSGTAMSAGKASVQGSGDPLDALVDDGNAPGTKLYGTLTIYYVPIAEGSSTVDMTFFLRLRKGSDLYGFSGPEPDHIAQADYRILVDQKEVIKGWVERIVIPKLYSCSGDTCPAFVVKSASEGVADDDKFIDRDGIPHPCPECVSKRFSILDLVIAVQE